MAIQSAARTYSQYDRTLAVNNSGGPSKTMLYSAPLPMACFLMLNNVH